MNTKTEIDNQVAMSDGQAKALVITLERLAGSTPLYVGMRQIMPLDLSVVFADELSAYKLAYAYREHAKSRVRVLTNGGPKFPGSFSVVLTPQ